jgi:hypothetical protein
MHCCDAAPRRCIAATPPITANGKLTIIRDALLADLKALINMTKINSNATGTTTTSLFMARC